jgi:hypothetical protein
MTLVSGTNLLRDKFHFGGRRIFLLCGCRRFVLIGQ